MVTRMHTEAAEAAAALRLQFSANQTLVQQLGASLRQNPPRMILTCARGSSANAATYAKYLFETYVGTITAAAAPSVYSVYAAQPTLDRTLCVLISQSGASPDLLAFAQAARAGGATVVALVNVQPSPLSEIAHFVLPLHAGPEHSVAATKSFISSLAALLHLTSAWSGETALKSALQQAPKLLEQAWQLDWSAAVPILQAENRLYVAGRGPGLAMAQEAALKFKEVCGIHAEAFSAAELQHGPITLAQEGFPVLLFTQDDPSKDGMATLADALASRQAKLVVAGLPHNNALNLPTLESPATIAPLLLIMSFYRLADSLAQARDRNPDAPPFLNKITRTV